ncbi:MAG: GNAT family N-acetyltransferase [Saprospiraceae bacterium]|nr:GNAT family N-acetyltransferase [Candidatus Defluviibacterium haderslevense]
MNLRFQYNTDNINWEEVSKILQKVGMAFHAGEKHKRAFNNSHTVVFVFENDHLIGFGRAISDGEYQAAIYDVAIIPEYQRMGIGKTIIQKMIDNTPGCNYILYAAPGKERFYEKIDFRKMKTAMALFINKDRMQQNGFTD